MLIEYTVINKRSSFYNIRKMWKEKSRNNFFLETGFSLPFYFMYLREKNEREKRNEVVRMTERQPQRQ